MWRPCWCFSSTRILCSTSNVLRSSSTHSGRLRRHYIAINQPWRHLMLVVICTLYEITFGRNDSQTTIWPIVGHMVQAIQVKGAAVEIPRFSAHPTTFLMPQFLSFLSIHLFMALHGRFSLEIIVFKIRVPPPPLLKECKCRDMQTVGWNFWCAHTG